MTEEEKPKPKSIGLWAKKKKSDGEIFYGGKMQNYRVCLFINTKEDHDYHSTLTLFPEDGTDLEKLNVKMFLRKSKKGLTYIRGVRGKLFMVFANTNKKNPSAPSYNLIIDEAPPRKDIEVGKEQVVFDNPATTEEPKQQEEIVFDDDDDIDDIPF